VAKNDSYSTRGSAYVDDDADDAYLRPAQPSAAPSSSRARGSRGAERDASRGQAADRLLDKAAEGLGQRVDDDEPFLRTRRRVPVKKGLLPLWTRTRWGRVALAGAAVAVLAGGVALVFTVKSFFEHDPRFRIDTASSIQTVGNSQLSRTDLLSVFGSDIGRNLFYVPLVQRRAELEQIPWVQHATVMRLLPNELRVAVTERTPIAFVRVGDQVKLVDAEGVILDMPPAMMAARHFSFPVVTGIHPGDLLSARKPRMQMYQKFLAELDASGEKLSEQMSEIDLSDPEDVRATVPAKSTDLLLHFGEQNFLARYRVYQSHLSEWEQQYPRLAAVDLRYDGQVVLKMADGKTGDGKAADTPAASPAPGKADASAAKPVSKAAPKAGAKSIAAKKRAARQRREAQR
jgi:cell division protein FtsQ